MHAASVFFMSDAHLGVDPAEQEGARTARLHDFLNSLPGRASSLYIVGDLFDFWFEYRTAIPRRYFPTLAVLQGLRATGLDIAYLNGNHDFWLGRFFRDTLGIRTIDGGATVEAQGRRLWLHHGDGLLGGELGYRALRGVLRSRAGIARTDACTDLMRSRTSCRSGATLPRRPTAAAGAPVARDPPSRASRGLRRRAHRPLPSRVRTPREPNREFFLLGDWIDHFTTPAHRRQDRPESLARSGVPWFPPGVGAPSDAHQGRRAVRPCAPWRSRGLAGQDWRSEPRA
jgi:hypothetical protein